MQLTWWANEDAYAFMALPEEPLRDVLYRPVLLGENAILWQSAYPFDPDGLVLYEVFITLHYDDALIPLLIDADKLTWTLQMAGVMMVPTPQTPGLVNASDIWTLVGHPGAIDGGLAEVIAIENAVIYDHIIVPAAP